MTVIAKQSFTFRDARGYSGTLRLTLASDTAADLTTYAAALPALLNATTNAALVSAIGPYSLDSTAGYGSPSPYLSIEDHANLTFSASDGSLHKMGIPAPLSGADVFYEDAETVNPAGAAIAALVTALTGATSHAVTPRGHAPFTVLVGGMRTRAKNRRRTNIRTLTPDLSGPDE